MSVPSRSGDIESRLTLLLVGTAHSTAYDFFTQRPEGTFQVMNVLSDLGIPRDSRHHGSAGVSTYRFLNAEGGTTLFKWYFVPKLGYRSFVGDEMSKVAERIPISNGRISTIPLRPDCSLNTTLWCSFSLMTTRIYTKATTSLIPQ